MRALKLEESQEEKQFTLLPMHCNKSDKYYKREDWFKQREVRLEGIVWWIRNTHGPTTEASELSAILICFFGEKKKNPKKQNSPLYLPPTYVSLVNSESLWTSFIPEDSLYKG